MLRSGPLVKVSEVVYKNEQPFNAGYTDSDEACDLLQSCDDLEDAWASVAPKT